MNNTSGRKENCNQQPLTAQQFQAAQNGTLPPNPQPMPPTNQNNGLLGNVQSVPSTEIPTPLMSEESEIQNNFPSTPDYTGVTPMPSPVPTGSANLNWSPFNSMPPLPSTMFGQSGFVPAQTPNLADILPDITSGLPISVCPERLQYLNGFLRTQIGRRVTVDSLVGNNTMLQHTGTLLAVGINYILINEDETDDILACDFSNIKFIRFYY